MNGPPSIEITGEAAIQAHVAGFRMEEGETLADLLARYQEVAARDKRARGLAAVVGRLSAAT